MKNTLILSSTLIIALTTLMGCTSKQLYQHGQGHKKQECLKNATTEAEHRECLNAEKFPYEEYEKERQKVINAK